MLRSSSFYLFLFYFKLIIFIHYNLNECVLLTLTLFSLSQKKKKKDIKNARKLLEEPISSLPCCYRNQGFELTIETKHSDISELFRNYAPHTHIYIINEKNIIITY